MLSNHERRILNEIEADLTSASSRRESRRKAIVRSVRRLLGFAVLVLVIALCAAAEMPRAASAAVIACAGMAIGALLASWLRRVLIDMQWQWRRHRYNV